MKKEAPKLTVVYKPVDSLLPYARNSRTHDAEQVAQIAASIKEFGFTNPVLIDEDGGIIAGHGRVMAARKLNMIAIPTITLAGLSDVQKRAYVIADNKLALNAGWDEQLLSLELKDLELEEFNLELLGFSDLELDSFLEMSAEKEEGEQGEDEEAEEYVSDALTITPKSTPGTVWRLGRHLLMCGDSTNEKSVLEFCPAASLLLTDPPYGISIVNENGQVGQGNRGLPAKKYLPVHGDDSTETAIKAITIAKKITTNRIVFGGNYYPEVLEPSPCWLVWDKKGRTDFADGELAHTTFKTALKIYEYTWNGYIRTGTHKDEGKTRIHPTQKPVGLLAQILEDYSKQGDTVLDMFGGSGSTLIACEKVGRTCYMIEYEAAYCDLIVKRWQTYTGLFATRESDGKAFDEI